MAIQELLECPGLAVLAVPGDVVNRWVRLLREFPVTKQRIFDVQLVATMLGNGVRRICTFNSGDFEQFTELEVIVPNAVR